MLKKAHIGMDALLSITNSCMISLAILLVHQDLSWLKFGVDTFQGFIVSFLAAILIPFPVFHAFYRKKSRSTKLVQHLVTNLYTTFLIAGIVVLYFVVKAHGLTGMAVTAWFSDMLIAFPVAFLTTLAVKLCCTFLIKNKIVNYFKH